MKKILSLILICQVVCVFPLLSQTGSASGQVKPATDACPTWNKKQTSKADYFAYLSKRPVTKEVNNFYTPKYRNLNTTSNNTTKKQKQLSGEAMHSGMANTEAPAMENKIAEPLKPVQKSTETPAINNSTEKTTSVKETTGTVTAPKKDDSNKKNSSTIHIKKHLLKRIGFRKKSATSCPEF